MSRDSYLNVNLARERDEHVRRLARLCRSPGGFVSQQTYEQRLRSAAAHEAGHVVSALALGFEVQYTIVESRRRGGGLAVSGDTELGLVRLDMSGGSRALAAAAMAPDALRKRAVQVLAGQYAERFLPHSDDYEVQARARGDDERAIQCAVAALRPPPEDAARWVAEWLRDRDREVVELLTPWRPLLGAVANVLLEHVNVRVTGETLAVRVPGLPNGFGEASYRSRGDVSRGTSSRSSSGMSASNAFDDSSRRRPRDARSRTG